MLVALATVAVACIDMSAPKGPASISQLQLPSGYVVRGDVMRDSTGAPANLTIVAYDANGGVITDAGAQFFIIDSAPAAHFDANGMLVGDRLGSIRVVGQVGNLQTQLVSIPITVAPATIAAVAAPDTIRAAYSKDSANSVKSTALSVVVKGAGDTTVQGVIVHFTLTRTLASSNTNPAVYILRSTGKPASSDTSTTDASGKTSTISLYVYTRNLADQALQAGQKIDSVIVEASATYKGLPLAGSPVRLVFPVRVVPSF